MIEEQQKHSDLLDTTDSLEAVGVVREWKNFLFVLLLLSMLVMQAILWFLNTGIIKHDDQITKAASAVVIEAAAAKTNIEKAAEKVAADVNLPPAEAKPVKAERKHISLPLTVKFSQLSWLITFLNFTIALAAVLYCLTMLFCVKLSLVGRLGGINHITRAFFTSLLLLILLLPWQKFFGGVVTGLIFTPEELLNSFKLLAGQDIFGKILYYVRFGATILMPMLLICAQARSIKWTKATLRRLEVV